MDVKPAFSIITGDITQNGLGEDYILAKEYIREIEALGGSVISAVGNTDRRENFRSHILESTEEGPCFYSRTVEGFRVIVLDSQTSGAATGSFGGRQLKWLEEELRGSTEPSLIAFHHPVFDVPFLSGMTPAIFDPDDVKRFREIVSRGGVLGVLCGHLHQCMVSMEGGVLRARYGKKINGVYLDSRLRARGYVLSQNIDLPARAERGLESGLRARSRYALKVHRLFSMEADCVEFNQ